VSLPSKQVRSQSGTSVEIIYKQIITLIKVIVHTTSYDKPFPEMISPVLPLYIEKFTVYPFEALQRHQSLNPHFVGLLRIYCLKEKWAFERTVRLSINSSSPGWQNF